MNKPHGVPSCPGLEELTLLDWFARQALSALSRRPDSGLLFGEAKAIAKTAFGIAEYLGWLVLALGMVEAIAKTAFGIAEEMVPEHGRRVKGWRADV